MPNSMETAMKISLSAWDRHYTDLCKAGLSEPAYGGPLSRHAKDGDLRLNNLHFDNSPAALRLWNFLLTEEGRLREARMSGKRIVGVMKDLGTTAVLADSFDDIVTFYPDGAWWTPCIMKNSDGLLDIADKLGINESFCPVRAMLGAFVAGDRFPRPDLLFCAAGAVCDDFSAIAQRLESLGFTINWWELPHRRDPEPDEKHVVLPGQVKAPAIQVEFVQNELIRIMRILEAHTGQVMHDAVLSAQIRQVNHVRRLLKQLRKVAYTAEPAPLPALEMLIAEMLAIHFCSDRRETVAVLTDLLEEVHRRTKVKEGPLASQSVRVFWINPVADLRMMNLLEECGGRICGSEYLFTHALDEIPEDLSPIQALARAALADPMIGSATQRADRICREIQSFAAEAVVISHIPGASHCSSEAAVIAQKVRERYGLPIIDLEVPPLIDSIIPTLRTRLEALMETARGRRS
jgi:benzoyl-CoA reductase/2-hydroxyglutaryl-CoA dehydratase subunit BcrC/BadD/HgdB